MSTDITEENFRDNAVIQVSVVYDWIESKNYAIITMLDSNDFVRSYRINELTEYAIYEDFASMIIGQRKLVTSAEAIYLSLDPYDERGPIEELDNFCFWGKSILAVSAQC